MLPNKLTQMVMLDSGQARECGGTGTQGHTHTHGTLWQLGAGSSGREGDLAVNGPTSEVQGRMDYVERTPLVPLQPPSSVVDL